VTPDEIPFKTRSDLEWSALLGHLASRCQTSRGKDSALSLPFLDLKQDVESRLVLIDECRQLRVAGQTVSADGVAELGPLLQRVDKGGILEPAELLDVARTLRVVADLRRLGRRSAEAAPHLAALLAELTALEDVRGAIEESFDETGALADHASRVLGELRQRARSLRDEVGRRLKGMVNDPATERKLQDTYVTDRDGRYVLPVKAECRHELEGIVLGYSASGATVFVEPRAVTEINNQIQLAALEVEREERRILAELSDQVRQERAALEADLLHLALVDLLAGAARLAEDLQAGPARIADTGRLELRGLRHPLMVLAGSEVVSNDLTVGPEETLVVTGPNTGGKTVLLKTVGLAALMLRAGLPPPCRECSLPLYRRVLSDMGDDQSIAASLSTFSAHMSNVRRILEQARDGSLVLLDEVAVGTDPIQGAALARAIVEALADRRAQVLVTTHYAQLKELPGRDARFKNASLGFDLARVRPTYRVAAGQPGSSSALSVAARLGLPAELLDRAAGLLDPAAARLDLLLVELEREREAVRVDRERLGESQRDVDAIRSRLEVTRRELEEARRKLKEKAHDEAVTALRGARDELDRLRTRLRRAASEAEAARVEKDIARAASLVAAHAPRSPAPPSRPAEAADLEPGTTVWVPQLGGLAQVVAWPGQGPVSVQAGAFSLRVEPAELLVPLAGKPAKPQPRPAPPRPRTVETPDLGPLAPADDDLHARDPDTTCDLRGLRVEEAEAELDRFLDLMLQAEVPSVLIIHGHGTGALRQVVRTWLKGAAPVKRFRSGRQNEGGDGVTIAFLA
jgi:DNA mismatch repair protein MutS2